MSGTPFIEQNAFHFRNDNGTEVTATYMGALNSNQTLSVDTTYRLRFLVKNTGTAQLLNVDLEFMYNLGGQGWNAITTTSNVVRAVTTANFANGADCTQQLGTGTIISNNDGMTADGTSGGNNLDMTAGTETETELSFQIRSADVTSGQTIQIRLLRDSGTNLDAWTATPTATVSEPTAALKDIPTRFSLWARAFTSAVGRFAMIAQGWQDSPTRFRSIVEAYLQPAVRFIVELATDWADAPSRLYLLARSWRQSSLRLRLEIGGVQEWPTAFVRLVDTWTATDLIPGNAWILGVATEVIDAIAGVDGYTVGDADLSDKYGANLLATVGSQSGLVDNRPVAIERSDAAHDLLISPINGSLTTGTLDCRVFYATRSKGLHGDPWLTASSGTVNLSGATVTITDLIPVGVYVICVRLVVLTDITGATGFHVGDGSLATAFGTNIGLTAGTATDIGDMAATTIPLYHAGASVVLTALNGTFTSGSVEVTVYYADLSLPWVIQETIPDSLVGSGVTVPMLSPGKWLAGIEVEVLTDIVGPTSLNIGDDLLSDRFASGVALTDGTTTTLAMTRDTTLGKLADQFSVVLTPIGGSITAGAVAIRAFYATLTMAFMEASADAATRMVVWVMAFASPAVRFVLSVAATTAFLDITGRFGLWVQFFLDTAARFILHILAWADAPTRFRLNVREWLDAGIRLIVSVPAFASTIVHLELAEQVWATISLHLRLWAPETALISMRFPLWVTAFQDISVKLRQFVLTLQDHAVRFSLQAQDWRLISTRFVLGILAEMDWSLITTRLLLWASAVQDAPVRAISVVSGWLDAAVLMRLWAMAWTEISFRFTLRVSALVDGAIYVRLIVAALQDTAILLELVGQTYHEASGRFTLWASATASAAVHLVLWAQGLADHAIRAVLYARDNADGPLRFPLVVAMVKALSIRLSLIAQGIQDNVLRFQLSPPGTSAWQDALALFTLSATAWHARGLRLRVSLTVAQDTLLRLMLTIQADTSATLRFLLVGSQEAFASGVLRWRLSMLVLRDWTLRMRLFVGAIADTAMHVDLWGQAWPAATCRLVLSTGAIPPHGMLEFATGATSLRDRALTAATLKARQFQGGRLRESVEAEPC